MNKYQNEHNETEESEKNETTHLVAVGNGTTNGNTMKDLDAVKIEMMIPNNDKLKYSAFGKLIQHIINSLLKI